MAPCIAFFPLRKQYGENVRFALHNNIEVKKKTKKMSTITNW